LASVFLTGQTQADLFINPRRFDHMKSFWNSDDHFVRRFLFMAMNGKSKATKATTKGT